MSTTATEEGVKGVEKEAAYIQDSTKEMLDPILYWVGKSLAAGAVGWIGGEIMDGLFGNNSTETKKIARLLIQLVDELKHFIRQEIRADSLRATLAKLDGVESNYIQFINAPSVTRLELASNAVNFIVSDLKSFDIFGYVPFMNAVSLQIILAQERAKFFKDSREGELKNVSYIISSAISHHEDMVVAWRKFNFEGYRMYEDNGYIERNGVALIRYNHTTVAQRAEWLQRHADQTFQDEIYSVYIQPAEILIEQWQSIRTAVDWCGVHGSCNDIDRIARHTQQLTEGVHPTNLE